MVSNPRAGDIGPVRRRVDLEPIPETAPFPEPAPAEPTPAEPVEVPA
jgi:hypothetical protein